VAPPSPIHLHPAIARALPTPFTVFSPCRCTLARLWKSVNHWGRRQGGPQKRHGHLPSGRHPQVCPRRGCRPCRPGPPMTPSRLLFNPW